MKDYNKLYLSLFFIMRQIAATSSQTDTDDHTTTEGISNQLFIIILAVICVAFFVNLFRKPIFSFFSSSSSNNNDSIDYESRTRHTCTIEEAKDDVNKKLKATIERDIKPVNKIDSLIFMCKYYAREKIKLKYRHDEHNRSKYKEIHAEQKQIDEDVKNMSLTKMREYTIHEYKLYYAQKLNKAIEEARELQNQFDREQEEREREREIDFRDYRFDDNKFRDFNY